MPDINQAMADLAKAVRALDNARAEDEAAQKDEEAKLAAMRDASKAVMKAQGKDATAEAGRVFHAAEQLWKKAKTKREKADGALKTAEKAAAKAMIGVNEALTKLAFGL